MDRDPLDGVVRRLLLADRRVTEVALAGSRARGDAGPFSDWDFVVRTDDLAQLAADLPHLLAPLDPLVAQWDRLSDHPCYMLLLDGPVKVDLIFEDLPHTDEPPWTVDATTLPRIDDHAWDWILWLTSKVDAGRDALVRDELARFHRHILAPMGAPDPPPADLDELVDAYLDRRAALQRRLGVAIDSPIEDQVRAVVARLSGRTPGGTPPAAT